VLLGFAVLLTLKPTTYDPLEGYNVYHNPLALTTELKDKAGKLASYALTVDPSFNNRTVWSEANVQRWAGDPTPSTIIGNSTPFHANYMYPIVQFAPIHPTGVVNLNSDATTLLHARQTVWGQNFMSNWAPENGLCLAWPSAARLVDAAASPRSAFGTHTLVDAFEAALDATMQPNLWPSMGGGGVEQVGATQAVNDLLLQSVDGELRFFPGWGDCTNTNTFTTRQSTKRPLKSEGRPVHTSTGSHLVEAPCTLSSDAVTFVKLRTPGAFLVSATKTRYDALFTTAG
jgi:hypothetical protein